jgi:hypothetical protein
MFWIIFIFFIFLLHSQFSVDILTLYDGYSSLEFLCLE